MSVTLLELAGALLIGAALGLLGGGGSILTVPVFVYAAGLDPKVAVAASLPVVAATSASAAIAHWRLGNVQVRTALIFGVAAAIGSFAGARLASFISGATQFTLLAVVMLGAAVRMLTSSKSTNVQENVSGRISYPTLITIAVAVGVLTGVVGIGGGFLIVPTLVLLCHLPMRVAVGTSLMVIAMNAASGIAGYSGTVEIPWQFVIVFSVVAIVGSLTSSKLASRVPQEALRRAFGVLLVCLSILILVQNRHVFAGWISS